MTPRMLTTPQTIDLVLDYEVDGHWRADVAALRRMNMETEAVSVEAQYSRFYDGRASSMMGFPEHAVFNATPLYHDLLVRHLWSLYGPPAGVCEDYASTCPVCPLVLVTAVEVPGNLSRGDKTYSYVRKEYKDPGAHTHDGGWKYHTFMQSGIGAYLREYYFKTPEQRFKTVGSIRELKVPELELTEVITAWGIKDTHNDSWIGGNSGVYKMISRAEADELIEKIRLRRDLAKGRLEARVHNGVVGFRREDYLSLTRIGLGG